MNDVTPVKDQFLMLNATFQRKTIFLATLKDGVHIWLHIETTVFCIRKELNICITTMEEHLSARSNKKCSCSILHSTMHTKPPRLDLWIMNILHCVLTPPPTPSMPTRRERNVKHLEMQWNAKYWTCVGPSFFSFNFHDWKWCLTVCS